MKLIEEMNRLNALHQTRRHFLQLCSTGLGGMALGSLLSGCGGRGEDTTGLGEAKGFAGFGDPMAPRAPHFAPKAKSVIYLHMAGSPSQLELFDYKPDLKKLNGQACPASLLEGKRFAFIRGVPKMLGPVSQFAQYGESRAWVSDYLPNFQKVVDDVTFLKAMHTDQFNHAPAQLLMHTGSARLGRPSMGSWVSYGLGTENANLPSFVVLASGGRQPDAGKSIWGSGFLPSIYQGVQCRTDGDPVLFLSNPDGMSADLRKKTIDCIHQMDQQQYEDFGDPETLTRIAQYELAFRMQTSVPDAMNINDEPQYIKEMYGAKAGHGSLANNILLARKLVEKGVRFVQIFDWGWDSHGTDAQTDLGKGLKTKCADVDKAMSALIVDLKQRGLLDETLVVWGGEFGRTPMQENRENKPNAFAGRDHHTEAFTVWMAGGGIKRGFTWGETDEIGYSGISGKTHVNDLQATILHQLGFDHTKLIYPFQGRPYRLTDVGGKVIKEALG